MSMATFFVLASTFLAFLALFWLLYSAVSWLIGSPGK